MLARPILTPPQPKVDDNEDYAGGLASKLATSCKTGPGQSQVFF